VSTAWERLSHMPRPCSRTQPRTAPGERGREAEWQRERERVKRQ
jgi:hypothetical protein